MDSPNHRHNGGPLDDDSARKLWDHVRALEVLKEQEVEIREDKKVRKALAKSDGFDTAVLDAIIKRREIGQGESRTADMMVRIYEEALEEQGALPLEQTRRQPTVRRTTQQIAEDLHQQPAPSKPGDELEDAAEALARSGVTFTFGSPREDDPF